MVTCRICQHESSDDRQFCHNCGYPLITFPPTLGQIPQKFQEVLSQREAWERQIWQRYTKMRSHQVELSEQNQHLQQQNQQLQQQIEQSHQVAAENWQLRQQNQQLQQTSRQTKDLQPQVESLKQENTKLTAKPQVQPQAQPKPKPSTPKPIQPIPQQQASPPSDQVSLRRAVEYSCTTLEDLLAVGQWRKADEETAKIMLKVAGWSKRGWLDNKDVKQFPCEILRNLDRFWVKYSNGHFGFSIQKEIYQSLGGTREYNQKIWEKFGDAVEWRQNGEWLSYSQLRFTPGDNTPKGHLPGFYRLSSLVQRLVDCNL